MSDPDTILEQVADEFLARIRAGKIPKIADYTARYPLLSDEISELLGSIEDLEQLSRVETDYRTQAFGALDARPAPQELGDFDIVRELGRGGMGVVYEAIDRTLQRRVALKVLNDSALATKKHVERFRRESRMAARLHHTNIVTVFGVGKQEEKHFYAMQYIEGVSLHDVIHGLRELAMVHHRTNGKDEMLTDVGKSATERRDAAVALCRGDFAQSNSDVKFSQDEPNPTAGQNGSEANHVDRNPFRKRGPAYWKSVAQIGIQVADALHYAHSHQVLHRDIKPANLLLDREGTVWVTDFGLAKLAETDELTKTGDVVGTLKYMAPEQLSGNADARTDVYALGLTLYELLTLKSAHDGESYQALFGQKQKASHEAPRKLESTIPRDLETIVQKALEWSPEKRYSTAKSLSADLRSFVEDRPISARRVSRMEHAYRWCLRNRLLSTLLTAVLAMLVLLPIILASAYLRESKLKQLTEANLEVVLDGFDELFGSYLETDLVNASATTGSSVGLTPALLTKDTAENLERMLKVYDRLAEQNSSASNLKLAIESAQARHRVGKLYQILGQFERATAAYQDAAKQYKQLSGRAPEQRIEVAKIHKSIGSVYEQRQDIALAHAEYEKALRIFASLPSSDSTKLELARTHFALGKHYVIEGEPQFPPPMSHPDDGFAGHPTQPPHDEEERSAHLKTAQTLLTELARHDGSNPELRFLLALCLGEAEPRTETSEDSQSALAVLQKLVEEYPSVSRYRLELCLTYRKMANQVHPDDTEKRIELLRRARALAEQLVSEQSNVAAFRISAAHVYAHLSVALSDHGDFRAAEALAWQSIETHESVVRDFPGLESLSEHLSINDRIRLGDWLLAMHRYEELVEMLRPVGDQLVSRLTPGQQDTNDSMPSIFSPQLHQCRELLLEAYRALGNTDGHDDVATWSDEGPEHPHRPPPQDHGFANGPRRGSGPGRGPVRTTPLQMILSYDSDADDKITQSEVPLRMRQEWFRRLDKNDDRVVDRSELESHFN